MLEIQANLRALLERYHDALISSDMGALQSLVQFPFVILDRGRVHKIDSPELLHRDIAMLRKTYFERGVSRLKRTIELVHVTGTSEAIAATHSEAYDAQGRFLTEWDSTYLLIREFQGWKIAKVNGTDQSRAWGGRVCHSDPGQAITEPSLS